MAERIEAEITDADFDLAKIKRLLAKSKSMQDRLRDAEWIDAIWKESGYKLTSLLRQETKWKSIGDTMINAAWIDALREETGYKLMTLLRQEPRLLTIKYCGCNVLHLAMRHNWYSLVLEILRKFEHLYKDASFLDRRISSRSEVEYPMEDDLHSMGLELASFRRVLKAIEHGGETSSRDHSSTVDSQATTGDLHSKDVYGLDLASFRDLLEAKEYSGETSSRDKGAEWKYDSGLDVFAMAVIQGDAAINTLLAEAVLQVDGLFDHPHPYKDVVRLIRQPPTDEFRVTLLSFPSFQERKLLREIMEKCFPDLRLQGLGDRRDPELIRVSEQPHAASNVSTSEQRRATNSQAAPATSGPNQLEHQLENNYPEWMQEWDLTSRHLPLEEFLFLSCFSLRNRRLEEKGREIQSIMLEAFHRSGMSFREYLLGIKDTRGSALHHMVGGRSWDWIWMAGMFARNPFNEFDSAGRTPLHMALSLDDKIDVDTSRGRKAAILSLLEFSFDMAEKYSLKDGCWRFQRRVWQVDVAAISAVNHYSPDSVFCEHVGHTFYAITRSPHLSDSNRAWLTDLHRMSIWGARSMELIDCPNLVDKMTWLQLAAYVGDTATLEILANDKDIVDVSRFRNQIDTSSCEKGTYETVLHAAAAAGHPNAIRTILATGKFDPLVQDHNGNTALHLATHFQAPFQFSHALVDFCEIPHRRIGISYQVVSTEERKDLLRLGESRRQGCINLLLQAGIDVWQTNRDKRMADPGSKASAEYSTWWYDKVSKETQEARTSLNAAANAISVTAALVATASYVGPLQPPMGYSEGLIAKVRVGVLSVRIFIACNTLAFYLALAAIMLSLTPSLPMPQESILDELKLIRRTVTLAVGLLILSMVSILVAFASASIAVIPDEGSWNHGGLTVYTLGIGGFVCFLVLVLCFFRLLRLIFHKRIDVRRFYKKYVCL